MSGTSKADDRRDFHRGGATGVNLRAIKEAKPKDVALRFVFGALISAVAAVVATKFGPRAGGLFLAFPAVLPAALTLVERTDGEQAAHGETIGAVGGAVGMIAFAGLLLAVVVRVGAPLALGGALAVWVVVAVGMYATLARVL